MGSLLCKVHIMLLGALLGNSGEGAIGSSSTSNDVGEKFWKTLWKTNVPGKVKICVRRRDGLEKLKIEKNRIENRTEA